MVDPRFPEPASDELLDIEDETRLELYRQVLRLRRFEERAYDLFMKGLVKGTSHLSLGMEAIAAGFGTAMRSDDYTFCTYRGHAHTLARGVPMEGVMAELLGRETGVCGGKGGSSGLGEPWLEQSAGPGGPAVAATKRSSGQRSHRQ